MNIDQMRAAIADVYPGVGWKHKCSAMSTAQVVAIYKSFLRTDRFNRPVKESKKEPLFHQLSIFELYSPEQLYSKGGRS